ncbi:hypothetical protein Gogos_016968 [Gossypium gossypioides]|uniref:Uncharacterized protein n=1 Tax=Gossypium gossypioides TaxID=34282 RepID=A0A7J9B980_GOSGO|nr:hypothetical protein [Gossypium gossypioides]
MGGIFDRLMKHWNKELRQ